MLETGIKNEISITVTKEKTAAALGSGMLEVFATPAMIALMEQTACESVAPLLDEGCGTVGTMLEVKHTAATPVGMKVTCKSELIEIDRKRLHFNIEVSDECGVIGTAVHDRFIINNTAFMEKTYAKLNK